MQADNLYTCTRTTRGGLVFRKWFVSAAEPVYPSCTDTVPTGRFQVLPGRPTVILDVAHNPHAASALAQNLGNMGFHPFTYAVFGVMQDKDIAGVVAPMAAHVDHWCLAALPSPRSASTDELVGIIDELSPEDGKPGERSIKTFADPGAAYADAMSRAGENDRIVVFGSFYTVAGVMAARKPSHH